MNEIVKYHNQMNKVSFKGFSATELNLLMSICSRMRDKQETEIQFSFSQLKELSKYDKTNNQKRFLNDLENTYRKLIKLDFRIETESRIIGFLLFNKYEIDIPKQTVTISVNREFSFVLNELTSNFTRFEVEEFLNIKSIYAKECYRRLKQFRTQGWWQVKIEEFRRLLAIPEVYQICNIDTKILVPIKRELTPIFKNFKITKIKKGKKVDSIRFDFETEKKQIQSIENQYQKNSQRGKKQIKEVPDFIDYELEELIRKGN